MKKKTLSQLALELGVSSSYLCQVRNGKKKPSKELLTKLPIEALITNKKLTKQVNFTPQPKLIFGVRKSYNSTQCAEVAQSVEQRTENPRVPSSILGLGTRSGHISTFQDPPSPN